MGDDASRAERAAESARQLARRKIAEARAEADRRVAEAARDERLRAERRARETRLANAAARRAQRGAWGDPPEERTPSGASFFGAETTASPRDAAYKTRAKANDAARAEAAAWAAAREMKARDDVETTRPKKEKSRGEVSREEKSRGDTSPPNGVEGDSAEGDSGYSEGDSAYRRIGDSASFYVAARESRDPGVFAVSRVVQSRRDAGERGRGETTRGGSRSRRARGSNLRPIGK